MGVAAPGVGDVCIGSVEHAAAAIGEGSTAVRVVAVRVVFDRLRSTAGLRSGRRRLTSTNTSREPSVANPGARVSSWRHAEMEAWRSIPHAPEETLASAQETAMSMTDWDLHIGAVPDALPRPAHPVGAPR